MTNPQARDFIETVAPFNLLSEDEFERALGSLTPAHFSPGETILNRRANPSSLYVVAEGVVEEADQEGPVAHYAAGASFDSIGLINGRGENAFVSRDRSVCYLMPAQLFHALSRSNVRFREHFQRDLNRRLDALAAVQQQREASSFLLAKLGEGDLHAPIFVGPETTIKEATGLMRTREVSALLVRDGERVGIFTERDVRERSVLMGLPDTTAIGALASYQLFTLDREDFLFNALVLMTERSIRHVVVTRDGNIDGIFAQTDLLSYLSNSSYVIASKLDRATNQRELDEAGAAVPRLIRALFNRGVKPRYIARIVTDLNRKVLRKVFEQVAPAAIRDLACLIVMGSEGRGEQLLRTDQDNGLIFRQAPDKALQQSVADAFTRRLIDVGYPPCPGNVMVSNPEWAKTLGEYRQELRRWIVQPTGEAFLRLAILYDASAVSGDTGLLTDIKAFLFEMIGQEDAFCGHFAKATLAFPTPLGMFNRFVLDDTKGRRRTLDIKKGGLFPIVHGVRSLALEYRVTETNTISRIQALGGRGPFGEDFTADLIEAFDFMAMLRLRQQFVALDDGLAYDNAINVDQLHSFERNLLRDSLKIVKQFKADISNHFRLNMLG
jgi:CBS domain-containing protein